MGNNINTGSTIAVPGARKIFSIGFEPPPHLPAGFRRPDAGLLAGPAVALECMARELNYEVWRQNAVSGNETDDISALKGGFA